VEKIMKGMCKKCDKRNECVKLCQKAEAYVNQDYLPQNEYIPKVGLKGAMINETPWESINLDNPSILKLTIIRLWKDGKSIRQILQYVPCHKTYIHEVIVKYRKVSGKLRNK
jgi:hypothetical protein